MAAKTFREDLRRARLEAINASKSISKPETKPVEVKPPVVEAKPVEVKPPVVEAKPTKIKKELE